MRVLKQLASDKKSNYPLGAEILCEETYMNDTLSGADILKNGIKEQGRFDKYLHKWMANDEVLLSEFPENLKAGLTLRVHILGC